ncbi:hypothetical protein LTR85_005604 [Meristemomyces frigidus]|nr:hypothetical protein LTR85_005604 [Meristemomyces frigidus]
MPANFGNTSPRGGSNVPATAGAPHESYTMQPPFSPRPSYQSLSSEYSVATAFAVDRVTSVNAPPVPALPVAVGYEQGSSRPIYATPSQAKGMRVMTRSGKILRAGTEKLFRPEALLALAASSPPAEPFEIITHEEASTSRYSPAEQRLNAAARRDERYSPPHYMARADLSHLPQRAKAIKARQWKADATHRSTEVIEPGSISAFQQTEEYKTRNDIPVPPRRDAKPAKSHGLRHYLMRGVGPETSFNVSVGDAVLLPEASAIPYASNSPRERPVGLFRSFSKTAHRGFRKVAGIARRGSDAVKPDMTHVQGSFAFDKRSYPDGAIAVNNSVPVSEAQTQQSQRPRREQAAHYPNALPPKSRTVTKKARNASLRESNRPTPAYAPAVPRKVKIVGSASRQTVFGDFIDSFDDSDSDNSVQVTGVPHTVDQSTRHLAAPPALPTASETSLRAAILSVKRAPLSGQEAEVEDVPPPLVWRSAKEVADDLEIAPTVHATDLDDFGGDHDSDDDDFAGHEYGHWPEYADEVFDDNSIIRQIDQMSLSLQERQDAATEAGRLRKMFDRPPPGAMGVDVEDFEPTTVIDTVRHDQHTSWLMTDTTKPNVVQSYYKQVQNLEAREPDEATELFEHLERERYGRSLARKTASNRR